MPYSGGFYKKLNQQALQCQLCHHYCVLKKNEVGKCRTRKNKNGKIISLVYGHPVAISIDPIEKKPLFHFLPGKNCLSLGTLGCNFICQNCQNFSLSQADNLESTLKTQDFINPKKIIAQAKQAGCPAIAFTYNEPTIFTEYALEVMKLAKANHLKTIWVSNGYMSPECLKEISPYLDAINVDVKGSDSFYQTNCGAKLEPVLNNLKAIKKQGIHLEITTLIIPNLSDDFKILNQIASFIVKELGAETPWHLSAFSPEISWRLQGLLTTHFSKLQKAYDIGKANGLKYIYLGNVVSDKESTYCPNCGILNINRTGYLVERLDNHGHCKKCQQNLNIKE